MTRRFRRRGPPLTPEGFRAVCAVCAIFAAALLVATVAGLLGADRNARAELFTLTGWEHPNDR